MTETIWMVRAGKGADYVDDFIGDEFVGIGFPEAGDVDSSTTRETMEERMALANPREKVSANRVRAAQVVRFLNEIQLGDWVTTYDPNQRLYFLGKISSAVTPRDHDLHRSRTVAWQKKIPRDVLKVATRNSLGAISAMFLIKEDAAADMMANAIDLDADVPVVSPTEQSVDDLASSEEATEGFLDSIVSRASDYIEDCIARLDWEEMQQLVAEILKAMGYRTNVAQAGPDRGVDVFASPDGLGLTEPRIFVEVKHRQSKMGSQEIRAFLGGRQPGDRCLYVSTGGFSKEAKYEADRSPIPIRLITLPGLRELIVEHYENMSPEGKVLVPLRLVYWPVER